jgi:hypothetical protein
VPTGALPILAVEAGIGKVAAAVARLVAVGLWEEAPSGWRVHDYLAHQPSAAVVKAAQASNARRQALFRDGDLKAAIRDRDRDRCRYCGVAVAWSDRRSGAGGTYDHVDPAGGNAFANLVVACRACNAAKRERTPAAAGMPLLPPPSGPRSPTGSDGPVEPDRNQNVSGYDQAKTCSIPHNGTDNVKTPGLKGGGDGANVAPAPPPPREARPIPKGLAMTDDDASAARALGMAADEARREWARFTAHYEARGDQTRTDWGAAWLSWLGKVERFGGTAAARNAARTPPPSVVRRGDGDRYKARMGRE